MVAGTSRGVRTVWAVVAAIFLVSGPAFSQVVINELMYYPLEPWPPTQEFRTTNRTEYIEIFNAGASPVDLGSYRFEDGVSFDFTPGTILAPGAYAVICEDLNTFTNAYPSVTNLVGQYSGRLSNGGERITLSCFTNGVWATQDTIHYIDDEGSDGTSYSLELVNPGLFRAPNQYFYDWMTSLTVSGTPGEVNSVIDPFPPPIAGDVEQAPPLPPAGSAVRISARVTGRDGDAMTSVILRYRNVNTGGQPWTDVAMVDDGSMGDDLAGDGVYTTMIPTNGAPQMQEGNVIEFTITPTDLVGSQTFPAINRAERTHGSISYLCKFGEDTHSDVAYPGEYDTFHALMTSANEASLHGTFITDNQYDCTFVTPKGDVHYNSSIRYRGSASRISGLGSFIVYLPNGETYDNRTRIAFQREQSFGAYAAMSICGLANNGYASEVDLARFWIADTLMKPNGINGDHVYCLMELFTDEMMQRLTPGGIVGNRYWANGEGATQGLLEDLGSNPNTYMPLYVFNINHPPTAWVTIPPLIDALNDETSNQVAKITNVIDVAQWGRHFASLIFVDSHEAGMCAPAADRGGGDELKFYHNPNTGLHEIFPWDLSEAFPVDAHHIWGWFRTIPKFLHTQPVVAHYCGSLVDIANNVLTDGGITRILGGMRSEGAGFASSFENAITAKRNAVRSAINTNLTVDGHNEASPVLMVASTNVGTALFVPDVDQNVSPAQWVSLGSSDFPGFGEDLVSLTRIKSGRSGASAYTVADAVMFSNVTEGAIIVDNDDPGYRIGLSWSENPSGGYTNGSYHFSNVTAVEATWRVTLPSPGTYDVYAWLFQHSPGSDDIAQYEIIAAKPHLLMNLTGTAPQNYTASVKMDSYTMDWNLKNNSWSASSNILINADSKKISVAAFNSEGDILKSLEVHVVGDHGLIPESGTIAADETWTDVDGIIHITADVTVSPGVTLTLDPGTIVRVAAGAKLIVNGTVNVRGLPDEPVEFYSHDGTSPWSLEVSGAAAELTLSNALVVAGAVRIVSGGTAYIVDSELVASYDADGIIHADGGGYVLVQRSHVHNFTKTRFTSTPVLIEHCLLEGMQAVGIEFVGAAAIATVSRTTFRNPAGSDGILFNGATAGLVKHCLVEGMTGTGIVVQSSTVQVLGSLVDNCGTGVDVSGSSSVEVRNETLVNCGTALTGNADVTNAIIWYATVPVSGGPAVTFYSDIAQPSTNVYPGIENINRNPFFNDESVADYRLTSISPCRATGFGSADRGAEFPVGANPATPTSLTLHADTNAMHLAWQDNSGNDESAFEIERSLDGENWVRVATLGANATNYWDFGLAQNTLYHYRVRAINNRGLSFYSDSATRVTGIEDLTQLLIDNLRITEFMYNSPDPLDGDEFIEIKNISETETLDVSGLFFDNNRYAFPPGTALGPTSFFVLVRDPVAFGNVHPGVAIDGVYTVDANLSNAGETLWIQDAGSNDIVRFRYEGGNNDPNWYPTTDGGGYSMVSADPNPLDGDPNLPVFWRASTDAGGSPGADDPNPGFGTIVINELLAHQDVPSGDVVEFYNAGSSAVDMGGWFLSDDETSLRKYTFPASTIIGASNYLLRTENAHFGTIPAGSNGFAFSELGDEIILSSGTGSALTSYRTMEKFGATENNVTLGRYTRSDGEVDFVALSVQTPAAANAYPRIGPVVINEIMYNPSAGGKEYVEMLNASAFPIQLYDIANPTNTWQFDGAMEYTFPTGVTIAAGEHLLVVSVQPDAFRQVYGLSNSPVRVFGPFAGDLNNGGESVKLYFPGEPEPGGFVPRIRTDRVKYDDTLPWPTSADNGGPSLERKISLNYGNDPINWAAASMGGTPGDANNTIGLPSVGFPDVSSAALESNETITITLSLLPQVTATVTVQYAVSGGTATRNSDYTFEDDTLIFWPYETNHTISLTILDDTAPAGEPDETIEISIVDVSTNAVIGGNAVYTHTTIDDDATSLAAPTIQPSATTDFTNSVMVTIQPPPTIPGSTVFYTLDGTRPTQDDFFYTGPFQLTFSARVTARTFLGSTNAGNTASVLFRKQPDEFAQPQLPDPPLIIFADFPGSNHFKIMWESDPSGQYTVYRAVDLPSLPGVALTSDVPADPSGTNMYIDSAATNGEAYYVIGVDTP